MVGIVRRADWALPESAATPEHLFLNRRTLVAGLSGMIAATALPGSMPAARAQASDQTLDLYPAKLNDAYPLDRAVTPADVAGQYNNFYEFGSHKQIAGAARSLKTRPWTVRIDGLVESEREIGIDELIRAMSLEERLYRHRCVEAWSMTVPWTGFPLARLIDYAAPLSSAKYLRLETFMDPEAASGQRQVWYPWPYVEGLTMAEARNELAFMVTGVYGKPLENQFGAPLRLALPWKYGFKSIKSIVRISFVDERPMGFWEQIAPSEYGFWANVNPQVPHPRWSQAQERVLHTGESVPTLLFNGYGEQVAGLYAGLEGEKLYS
ncbi:protein-methionine-sulfoxide reductase catalytic subunit MsrP [Aquibium sp. ELW1220]|uniref:protein-methionine-sulfoxide reductase catalytic subunit MsrP n=1 Tax=Aquibium sp. ELW1220 TaxID=2976766 RepID=UPI0025AF3A9A|nr:protein-methionine-sulfoxide reductase catalytic subunit MsrP [Aquibium sp. ELW1220]MDN2579299.1 protein-methionine-sulfoxide reductase catalytic subunit MsrP [Aquibium sp. ELW1220]